MHNVGNVTAVKPTSNLKFQTVVRQSNPGKVGIIAVDKGKTRKIPPMWEVVPITVD
jgi:hypothetical protein